MSHLSLVKVECLGSVSSECYWSVTAKGFRGREFSRSATEPVDAFQQLEAVLQRLRRNLLAQRQIFQLYRFCRILIKSGRDRSLAEKADASTFADNADSCKGRGNSINGTAGSWRGLIFSYRKSVPPECNASGARRKLVGVCAALRKRLHD
jgi:hypothetical protein